MIWLKRQIQYALNQRGAKFYCTESGCEKFEEVEIKVDQGELHKNQEVMEIKLLLRWDRPWGIIKDGWVPW